jgi:hypothetical protein
MDCMGEAGHDHEDQDEIIDQHEGSRRDSPAGRRWMALISTLCAAALISGCGGGTSGAGSQYGGEEFGLTFEELAERVDQVEVAVGECMAAQGFEYVPVDFSTVRDAMTSDKSAPGMAESEFIDTYGFGITTQEDKPIVTVGRGDDNRRIIESLSEADRVAYLRALYGRNTDATFAYGLEDEDFSRTGGCTRTAVEQYFTEEELKATYLNPADALVEQDPRVQDALESYAQCMSEAGFEFGSPDAVEGWLWDEYDALVGERDPAQLEGAELAALDELRGTEVPLARASQDCERRLLEPVVDRIENELIG